MLHLSRHLTGHLFVLCLWPPAIRAYRADHLSFPVLPFVEEERKWWSIGRGRKDSKEKSSKDKENKMSINAQRKFFIYISFFFTLT